jgi:NADH-quinone oxidoreductase subunit A
VLESYGPVALFLIVALIFPVVPLGLSQLLAPKRPDPVKSQPYESGMTTIGPTHIQFRIRYYLYALIFVIFDVEVLFLFPWALVLGRMTEIALIEMGLFVAFLLVGYVYAWRKGDLEWM